MLMSWSPLSKYNNMAAGLKSAYPQSYFLTFNRAKHSGGWGEYEIVRSSAVILLSFVLAVGFLMIILSCALWSNWLPLFVGSFIFLRLDYPFPLLLCLIRSCAWTALTFIVAPLPNALFSHCGGEDFSTDYGEGSGPIDLGRFITAFIVVTGFALPLVLAHSEIIKPGASIMSLIGGGYVRSYVAVHSLLSDNQNSTYL